MDCFCLVLLVISMEKNTVTIKPQMTCFLFYKLILNSQRERERERERERLNLRPGDPRLDIIAPGWNKFGI